MPKDVFLHPDFVEEVVEELLSTDIIGKEKIALLKNDSTKIVDPNMVMDIRHKEVKKESLIDFVDGKVKLNETTKREILKSCLKPIPKMKDLKTIDKEIAVTKKNLLAFQNQLEKKHESFLSTIVSLEEQEIEQSITTPLIVNLNEEEANQYFSLHLDNLENRKVQNFSRRQANVWKPFEIKPSSVINVITNFKDFDKNPPSIQYDDEEYEMLSMLKMDPIHITGKTLLNLSSEQEVLQEEVSNTVPSNTPSLYPYESCSMKGIESSEMKRSTDEIARKVIQRWKLFTTTKKIKRSEEETNRKRLNFELSQKIFKKWILFVHKNKAKKEEDILINNYLKKSKIRHVIKKKPVEFGKQTSRKCLELRKKNLDHCIDLYPIDICPQTIKSDILPTVKNAQKNSDNKMTKQTGSSKVLSKLSDEGKINIKTIKPEEVGLMNNERSDHQKHYEAVNNLEEQKSNLTLPKSEKSRIYQEPLNNRFAAQEKIIAQQLEVIEEQKKLIFDLHAHNLQVQSKLSLQVAESELAKASCNKKLKPLVRASETTKQTSNMLKLDEKSEQLCKNMLERQEYCKMLAERTKLRKLRVEEEKAKLKLEQEEKERQEKEEEKRQRALKIKMEQQLAREKTKKDLAYKYQITELSRKATNHYSKTLLKKTFKAFKRISFETYVKSNECNKMYERNMLKRVVVSWRLDAKESIASKCEMADKFYCSKLMERSWNIWRREHQEYRIKVQVSEDMFALKLQERMIRRWTAFASKQYLQTCCKMELADRLHRKQMLRHVFRHWCELPKLMFAERERDQRRRAWRQAVQELIPDFTPLFAEKLEA